YRISLIVACSLPWPLTSSPFSITAPSTTETSPLSLHDALPILKLTGARADLPQNVIEDRERVHPHQRRLARLDLALDEHQMHGIDRKSTRLNSSHVKISYAVFCLKKKK